MTAIGRLLVTQSAAGDAGADQVGEDEEDGDVGVGPHPQPWPDDPRLDPDLLARGYRRNVVDRYRYWTVEAIVADLDRRRHPFHVAIENFDHDLNIGTAPGWLSTATTVRPEPAAKASRSATSAWCRRCW